MINTSVNKNEHTIQSGVVDYPIGFPFYFNPDRTPQLLVKIGDEELRFNHNFELSEDKGSVVLRPTEEESWTLEGPEDFSWMTKWDGKDLLIERAVPFVQDSDYQLGRISSEQIERDFDLSVMRDQALDSKIKKLRNDIVDEFVTTDSRIDSVQEQTADEFRDVRDEFAEADKVVSNKIDETSKGLYDKIDETKAELQNSIDDKLPLTGGTLIGKVSFDIGGTAGKNTPLIGVKTASGTVPLVGAKTDDNGVLRDIAVIPNLQSTTFQATNVYASSVGSPSNPVTRIHAKEIGNSMIGTMLTIPDGPGTVARLEDIPETYTKEELDTKFAEIPDSVDTYSKAEIDAKLSSVYKFKGSVANVEALPSVATVGDTYNVEDTGANYAWDGSAWDKLSDTINLSDYATVEYAEELYFDLHGKLDKEITKRSSEDTKLYNNQIVLRNMLNEKDENDEFIKLTTEAQTAIPAINELNENKQDKLTAGNGITIEGNTISATGGGADIGSELDVEYKLTSWYYGFNSSDGHFYFGNILDAESPEDVNCFALTNQVYSGSPSMSIVNRSYGAFEDGEHYSFTEEWFGPGAVTNSVYPKNLGREEAPWQTVYATKLNNGADLELPTEGGTLARLEDLEGIGGSGDGDYLPLSGGTLTGALGFEFEVPKLTYNVYFLTLNRYWSTGSSTHSLGYNGKNIVLSYLGLEQSGNIEPGQIGCVLGGQYIPWKIVYAESIINGTGGALTVPTEGGTLARIEDINAIGGDGTTGQVLTKTDDGMVWQDAAGGSGGDCGLIIRRL